MAIRRVGVIALLVAGGFLGAGYLGEKPTVGGGFTSDASATVFDAFTSKRSGVWVNARGKVTRLLPDDKDGSRHQRFIVAFENGRTVLISHNIDLAHRLPLRSGDAVSLRGRYEYNDRGGVIHWTHHDPGGGLEGGWIEHAGQRYR